jgi:hypothetical protein
MFKHKNCSNLKKNVQILKIVRIVKKKKNEKKGNEKPKKKTQKKRALTGRPSVSPTRAERSFAPLTGVGFPDGMMLMYR